MQQVSARLCRKRVNPYKDGERTDLHAHLGASVDPAILWSIAHRQGIRLPTKDYWEFQNMVTMAPEAVNESLDHMNSYFHLTELIQSSPEAIEESVRTTIGGAYRKCNITHHELRFNPMKRNRGGERDLDYIISSALWGLERARLEYPQVRAGIILMMDREFSPVQNLIIAEKAMEYSDRGVIGLDLAGPNRRDFKMSDLTELFNKARHRYGLGITVHTGEVDQLDEMVYVVEEIEPDRIGHGIQCVSSPSLMKTLAERGITLEICPTSNLRNSVVKSTFQLTDIFTTLGQYHVKFALCTDGPELYRTSLVGEENFLWENGILSASRILESMQWAREAAFPA